MDRKYILAGTLFILTMIIGIVFVYPKYKESSNSSQALSVKRAEQEKLNVTVAAITRVYDSYKKSTQDIGRIERLLPVLDDQSIPKLFVEMEGLASQSGIFLNSISFKDEKIDVSKKSENSSKTTSGYKTIEIFLEGKGGYNSIKAFGDAIENNEHLMDITLLSIVNSNAPTDTNSTETNTSANTGQGKTVADLTYKIIISAYYQ